MHSQSALVRPSNGTLVIIGYGSGVSASVARRFGQAGLRVALASRTAAKVEAGARQLRSEGIQAGAFVVDASSLSSIERLITREVPASLGPVRVVHHNINYWPSGSRITDVTPDALQSMHGLCVGGLVVAASAALPQLRAWPSGTASVLVTNGGAGLASKAAAYSETMAGGFLCNAEKKEASRVLGLQLAREGIQLGEVVIAAMVSREAGAEHAVHPDRVADAFWSLHTQRTDRSLVLSPGPLLDPTDALDCRSQQPPLPPPPSQQQRRPGLVPWHASSLRSQQPMVFTVDGTPSLLALALVVAALLLSMTSIFMAVRRANVRLRCL